uniref:DUF1985 domain-containing protein n=1 Tax=Brassica oleracea TaxID=3712 RepID=A0A3P6EPG2_BRAOL|nr:unnamed protein product [Brassica oleracea]
MASFWKMMGVDVDDGPNSEQIIAAYWRCEDWSQENRMRLRYLVIFTGFIEGRNYSTSTQVLRDSLKGKYLTKTYTIDGLIKIIQCALPELGATFEKPLPNRSSPPLLAYMGGKIRIFFKEAINRHVF